MRAASTASLWDVAAGILDPVDRGEWWLPNPDDDVPGRARSSQRPPSGDWLVWLVMAGRGFGKTRAGAEWIDRMARSSSAGDQLLIAGRIPSDVRDYSLEGEGGLLTHHPDIEYYPSKRLLVWPNGAKALIRSGANPEEFRGFSGEYAWLDEFAAWGSTRECWENLLFGVRERDPRICITTTPRPVPALIEIRDASYTVTVKGSSDENRQNLSDKWFRTVVEPLRGTRLGRQEIEAELLEDFEGALWRREWIEQHRRQEDDHPELVRAGVGVDPQGQKGEGRETGIVVAGKGPDGRYYVIEDCSINGTPLEWANRVAAAYERHKLDVVVGESNFGGQMVEATLRQVSPGVSYREVKASRGKQQRAEPIAALYERGLVSHVGTMPALEDELCTWTPEERWSPNRLDSLVWIMTEISEAGDPTMIGGAW